MNSVFSVILFIVNMCIYINGNKKIRKFDLSGTLSFCCKGLFLSMKTNNSPTRRSNPGSKMIRDMGI